MVRRSPPHIQSGQTVKVHLTAIQPERELLTYILKEDEKYLELALPVKDDSLLNLPSPLPIQVSFLHKNLYYQFQAKAVLIGAPKHPAWRIDNPPAQSITLVNRRQQDRCPLRVAVLCHQANGAEDENLCSKGFLMDVSPIGARLASKEPLSDNNPLAIEFCLDQNSEPVLVQGRIVYRMPRREKHYWYGVSFEAIPAPIQKSIASLST